MILRAVLPQAARGIILRPRSRAASLALGGLISCLVAIIAFSSSHAASNSQIDVLTVRGVINPVTARYVERGIQSAQSSGSALVIIRLDTPGGMDSSMREIIQGIVNSTVPIVVYVSPAGARAASAGAFITMAGHIAAMAPNTAIGAAHPVGSEGEDIQGAMGQKVVNDAVAYIRSLAAQRNRNTDWVEKAVRESVSVTEREALRLNVIDLVEPDLEAIINDIDGRVVQVISGPMTIRSKNLQIVYVDQNLLERFMYFISDPTIAYILIALALLGLFLEMANPGAIVPGVIGGVSFLLALFALGMLPINSVGVLLIVLAFVLFLAEVKVVSHGVLTAAGVVSMAAGSLLLIDSSASYMEISRPVIAGVVLTISAFFVFAVRAVLNVRHRKASTGAEAILGQVGVARSAVDPTGTVFVDGELWAAHSNGERILPGDTVKVAGIDGLTLKVDKISREGE